MATEHIHPGVALLPSLLLGSAAILVTLASLYAPPARGEVAVVFPFGTRSDAAIALIAEAGGRLVSTTQLDNIVVAFATDPQFLDRVRALGALFGFAGQGLCTPAKERGYT